MTSGEEYQDSQFAHDVATTVDDSPTFEAAFRERLAWHNAGYHVFSHIPKPMLTGIEDITFDVLYNRAQLAMLQKRRFTANVRFLTCIREKTRVIEKVDEDLVYCIEPINLFKDLNRRKFADLLLDVRACLDTKVDITETVAVISTQS